MMVVDQEYMAMRMAGMSMRMVVGLRPFPTFMRVVVMFVVHMQVFVDLLGMHVVALCLVPGRPEKPGGKGGQQGAAGHDDE